MDIETTQYDGHILIKSVFGRYEKQVIVLNNLVLLILLMVAIPSWILYTVIAPMSYTLLILFIVYANVQTSNFLSNRMTVMILPEDRTITIQNYTHTISANAQLILEGQFSEGIWILSIEENDVRTPVMSRRNDYSRDIPIVVFAKQLAQHLNIPFIDETKVGDDIMFNIPLGSGEQLDVHTSILPKTIRTWGSPLHLEFLIKIPATIWLYMVLIGMLILDIMFIPLFIILRFTYYAQEFYDSGGLYFLLILTIGTIYIVLRFYRFEAIILDKTGIHIKDYYHRFGLMRQTYKPEDFDTISIVKRNWGHTVELCGIEYRYLIPNTYPLEEAETLQKILASAIKRYCM